VKILHVADEPIKNSSFFLSDEENSVKIFRDTLLEDHEVLSVLPKFDSAAKSSSISLSFIRAEKLKNNLYQITGTPRDCTVFGLTTLKFNPDIIVSGLNPEPNFGGDILVSATIGASLAALSYGYPTVSCSVLKGTDFHRASQIGSEILKKIKLDVLKKKRIGLNIIIPPGASLDKVIFTKQSNINFQDEFARFETFRGTFYLLTYKNRRRDIFFKECDRDDDVRAALSGYISVMPFKNSIYSNEELGDVLCI